MDKITQRQFDELVYPCGKELQGLFQRYQELALESITQKGKKPETIINDILEVI